jgi:CDP-diacylglycerol---glycerol-3-phosphate 3-phosphatidyltransferase
MGPSALTFENVRRALIEQYQLLCLNGCPILVRALCGQGGESRSTRLLTAISIPSQLPFLLDCFPLITWRIIKPAFAIESPARPTVVNLPNYITLSRIASVPLLIWLLCTSRFNSVDGEQEILASALFIAASITDGIDGYLARKRGQITTMGMLLDPLADKLLIAAAFVTLVQFNPTLVPAWIAVVIIGREFLVSGLRSIAASEGFTIEASDLGKLKMVVQIVSVVAVILDHRWKQWPIYNGYFFPVHMIAIVAIWIMVALSLYSAGDYFAAFWSKIDRQVVKRRRRAFVLTRRRKRDVPAI